MRFSVISTAALLVASATAHPGHDVTEEMAHRRAFKRATRRSDLSHCAAKLEARGIQRRNMMRRSALANALKKRSFESVVATDHNKTSQGYSVQTSADTLFADSNSCILTPEVTNGPYYVSGEYVRRDISEEQEGVPVTLDYQVIDVDTCDPIPNLYLEIWHCNATGVYSGVDGGQGGLDTTWLRGIQETDTDGVAQFDSIFPGHYTGRATHIHILVHSNATLYPNSTLGHDTTAMHVGQAFFDQALISDVEATSPYTANEQEPTQNTSDDILEEEAATDVDPFMSYTLLGSSVSDGIFAWLSFGVNTTYASQAGAAAILYEDGGVVNPDGPSAQGPDMSGTPGSGSAPQQTA